MGNIFVLYEGVKMNVNYISLLIFVVICCGGLSASEQVDKKTLFDSSDYIIKSTLQLKQNTNGINGKIALFQDKTLPKGIPNSELESDSYKNSVLAILSTSGKVIQSIKFKYPIAYLDVLKYKKGNFYKVVINEFFGMGSYSGKRTLLFDVKDGKIIQQKYYDESTKQYKDVVLYSAMKSGWKMIPNTEVLTFNQIYCKPSFGKDNEKFLLIYVSYVYNKKVWQRFENTQYGYWDFEHDFPNASSLGGKK